MYTEQPTSVHCIYTAYAMHIWSAYTCHPDFCIVKKSNQELRDLFCEELFRFQYVFNRQILKKNSDIE